MAKSIKKKPAKEASNIFHNIMKASVTGNPKPKKNSSNNSKGLLSEPRMPEKHDEK